MRPGRGAGENAPSARKPPKERDEIMRKYSCPPGCICSNPPCPNRKRVADTCPPPTVSCLARARIGNFLLKAKKFCYTFLIAAIGGIFVAYSTYNYYKHPEGALLADETARAGFDPCCAFPCLHQSVCTSKGPEFECDCTGTGHYGKVCERPTWRTWLINWVKPSSETVLNLPGKYPWLWNFINSVPFIHRRVMKLVYLSRSYRVPMPTPYSTVSDYITLDSYYNRTMYARFLPPIPKNCPKQMGVHGPKKLPPVEEVFNRIFRRRHFIPSNTGTNMYFATYAQFFTHQFFKTDYARGLGATFGTNEGVDVSQIYGQLKNRRDALRSFRGGKMKTAIVDGEDVPPMLRDAPDVFMSYPKGKTVDEIMEGSLLRQDRNVAPMWAMGHPIFSMTPMLFVVATLWLREHNRICDLLQNDHPDWDDERLYQTARLIVTGLMVRMTLTEYVQHLSQYKLHLIYDPELLHGTPHENQNRIFIEFAHLYHWHMLVPDVYRVEEDSYRFRDLLFTNNSEVFRHGFNRFLASMFVNIAGKLTARNHGEMGVNVGLSVLRHGRLARMQSFNNYRASFNLDPYKSFVELTDDADLANELRQVYGEVDAVEFIVGLFAEKHTYSTTPPTMVMVGGSWSVKGLMTNPVGTAAWWKPSTFGGRMGMDIIRDTTLRDFVCRNLRGNGCGKMHIAYTVPVPVLEAARRQAKEQTMPPVMRQDAEEDAATKEATNNTEATDEGAKAAAE